jgi:hypothetical protein
MISAQAGKCLDYDYAGSVVDTADDMKFPGRVSPFTVESPAQGSRLFKTPDLLNLSAEQMFRPS